MEGYDKIFQERLNSLVAHKLPFFRAISYRIVNSVEDADDAVPGAMIKAWKFRWLLRKPESTEGYIARIVVRESYNILRRRAKEQKLAEEYEMPVPNESELLKKLDHAIAQLPALYRETVHIALLSGVPSEEAARMLKCSTNTLYQRIHKAKALLKNNLEDDKNE